MKAPRLQLKARGNLEYSKSASANRQIWLKPTVCLEIFFFQIQLTELIIWQGFKMYLGTWNLFINCTVIFSTFCLIKAQATLCLTWFDLIKICLVWIWQTSRLTRTQLRPYSSLVYVDLPRFSKKKFGALFPVTDSRFPRPGTNPKGRWANLLLWPFSPENCMESWKIGPRVHMTIQCVLIVWPLTPEVTKRSKWHFGKIRPRTVLVSCLWYHFVGPLMVALVVMLPFDKYTLQWRHMFLNHIRHITIKWTLQLSTKLQVDWILFFQFFSLHTMTVNHCLGVNTLHLSYFCTSLSVMFVFFNP